MGEGNGDHNFPGEEDPFTQKNRYNRLEKKQQNKRRHSLQPWSVVHSSALARSCFPHETVYGLKKRPCKQASRHRFNRQHRVMNVKSSQPFEASVLSMF